MNLHQFIGMQLGVWIICFFVSVPIRLLIGIFYEMGGKEDHA